MYINYFLIFQKANNMDEIKNVRSVPGWQTDVHVKEISMADAATLINKTSVRQLDEFGFIIKNDPTQKFILENNKCACCGLIGNRAIVDFALDKKHQPTNELEINFYAETTTKIRGQTALVLMTIDHILPRKQYPNRNDQSNWQVFCYPCNYFKLDSNMSIQTMRAIMPLAQHINRNMKLMNQVAEVNAKLIKEVERAKKLIECLNLGLANMDAANPKKAWLQNKFDTAVLDYKRLKKTLEEIELKSQIAGSANV